MEHLDSHRHPSSTHKLTDPQALVFTPLLARQPASTGEIGYVDGCVVDGGAELWHVTISESP